MANARIKENILNQADKLPHEQYNLYVIQKIERGLKDEEAKRNFLIRISSFLLLAPK